MNAPIEWLSATARPLLEGFAWPMLWQSGLLIAIVLGLDLALKRRLRAAVRYSLWLVVLVKLVLPPSLALPTGAGWWVRSPAQPPAAAPLELPATFPNTEPLWDTGHIPARTIQANTTEVALTVLPPARRIISGVAWALVAWSSISLGLLAWVLVRWAQVGREARQAAAAPGSLASLLEAARARTGVRRAIGVKLTKAAMSPAVCGLFRPVILLPRCLVERLPRRELQTVLLHELIHLRRRDIWVNCAQGLVQVVYWWHPLVWLANARMRRLREEAVDDAVMLALRDEAESYALTLLKVAKLALQRPMASLGLVGILESRSSLRQRIERLLDFRPPRRAGLGLASVLAVAAFAAVAVPMGEPTASQPKLPTAGSQPSTNAASQSRSKAETATKLQDAKLLYELGKLNAAEKKLKEVVKADPENPAAYYYLNLVSERRFKRALNDPEKRRGPPVPNPYARTNLVFTSEGRQLIYTKLDGIHLENVSYEGLPLAEVLKELSDEVQKRDPEKRGINFLLNQFFDSGASDVVVPLTNTASGASGFGGGAGGFFGEPPFPPQVEVDPTTGLPVQPTPRDQVDMNQVLITISPPLREARLADVLETIVKVASKPIKYSIEDYAIVFSFKSHEPVPLYNRQVRLDPETFPRALQRTSGGTNNAALVSAAAVRQFLLDLGIDLRPPKTIIYGDRLGVLFVRATLQELDRIEEALQRPNVAPPQMNIKTNVVESLQHGTRALGFDWYLGNVLMNTGSLTGNLTGPQIMLEATLVQLPEAEADLFGQEMLGRRPAGVLWTAPLTSSEASRQIEKWRAMPRANISASRVTITAGHRAEVQWLSADRPAGTAEMLMGSFERVSGNSASTNRVVTLPPLGGIALDVTPVVAEDGKGIRLDLLAYSDEFLGYDDPGKCQVSSGGLTSFVAPLPLPHFRVRQLSSTANVREGQTLAIGGLGWSNTNRLKDGVPVLGDLPIVGHLFNPTNTNTVILLRPTILIPTANRLLPEPGPAK